MTTFHDHREYQWRRGVNAPKRYISSSGIVPIHVPEAQTIGG